MVTVDELLARARSVAGKGIKYKLGGGGMNPNRASPANLNGECDCSGYVCWALGISRETNHPLYEKFNGGWINTDAIVMDANAPTGFFSRLDTPRPGCLIVFASKPPTRKVGHVGIVAKVDTVSGRTVATKVIHCSHGNQKANQDAVCETDPKVFKTRDAIYAWYEGVA